MPYVKKIYTNYKDCSSNLTYSLPAIYTEKGLLLSHLRYLAWFNVKSESWKERSCFAVMLLLKYLNVIPHTQSATQILKSFTESLVTGTIDYQNFIDPLDLYWRPRPIRDANNLLFHITHYTDYLASQSEYGNRINPFRKATNYEERLNWCAYYHKQARVFLNHLTNKSEQVLNQKQVRVINGFNEEMYSTEYAVRFPDEHLDRLLYLGFVNRYGASDYKSQAITMLLNYGGLRKSEVFHIYVSDITLNPNHPKEALVRVYHPEFGAAPDPNYKNRKEYLSAKTKYKPRNNYLISERLYAGWKGALLSSKQGYFDVVFNPPSKAQEFLMVWAKYLKEQRVEPSKKDFHPFAFTNTEGKPETLKNFQRLHRGAVERIGLVVKKELGTTEHGHRHAYGFRARQSGLDQVAIQKAMHHRSPDSCLVYIKPTLDEVTTALKCVEDKHGK
ncbi:site-specific integrase [Wohlfahrtiimonas chitiniclastica]|uniref:Site-specific integrase n=1 Tax=Wohlfahrtiimonas chitiniclastica TaxID=400946 RepID=A0AB35C0D9_9GAMM|nr:gamma-mobile-trio recombinase GmtY [Wohlfahrtiimonas chitiniclastica]MBS7825005.1 site-specific integrase [Wohlfahrtiimonas chitiniclastica]MBS7840610.1 site-specific integrase [Wohlfahrtiimonas chitiniclastica]